MCMYYLAKHKQYKIMCNWRRLCLPSLCLGEIVQTPSLVGFRRQRLEPRASAPPRPRRRTLPPAPGRRAAGQQRRCKPLSRKEKGSGGESFLPEPGEQQQIKGRGRVEWGWGEPRDALAVCLSGGLTVPFCKSTCYLEKLLPPPTKAGGGKGLFLRRLRICASPQCGTRSLDFPVSAWTDVFVPRGDL